MIAPKFDKIKVLDTSDDIIMMDIDISFPSEASVKVSYLNSIASFLISSDCLSGWLSVSILTLVYKVMPEKTLCWYQKFIFLFFSNYSEENPYYLYELHTRYEFDIMYISWLRCRWK